MPTACEATVLLGRRWTDEKWASVLNAVYADLFTRDGLQRSHGKRREQCAKEALPAFVTFILQKFGLKRTDVFWDMGCGIGNVVMQAAVQAKCPCYGVELQKGNFDLAVAAWSALQERLGEGCVSHGAVELLNCCMTSIGDRLIQSWTTAPGNNTRVLVWLNNLLLPEEVNLKMVDLLVESLPSGSRVATTRPLFPHKRGAKRFFQRYAELFDIEEHPYPAEFVEWGAAGVVYFYTRRGEDGSPTMRTRPGRSCKRPPLSPRNSDETLGKKPRPST
eukprot:TRINITY_DN31825_c0_g1_i1.p1 TRINITY_DN31825_c0_g1~~TRINITY_DN31825_c0_g1_i1.p1  ORF type:complete len:276 (+),score=23.50 TRINITY_DN31825_c0_g1_i1:22-849(+)